MKETQPQQVSGATPEPAGADGLDESQTLRAELMRALQELMGSELDGRIETASKQMIEMFQSEDSGFLMVSPDVEKQLAKGEVDEAVARQRIRTAIADFETAEVPVPPIAMLMVEQFKNGQATGVRLELTAQVIEASYHLKVGQQ